MINERYETKQRIIKFELKITKNDERISRIKRKIEYMRNNKIFLEDVENFIDDKILNYLNRR